MLSARTGTLETLLLSETHRGISTRAPPQVQVRSQIHSAICRENSALLPAIAVVQDHTPCHQEEVQRALAAFHALIAALHREAALQVHFPGVHLPVHQEEDLIQVAEAGLHLVEDPILRVEDGNSTGIILFLLFHSKIRVQGQSFKKRKI